MALATIWALQSLGRGLGRNLLAALLGCVFVYFILVSGGRTGLLIVLCGAFAVMYSKVENPFVSLSVFAVLAVLALSGFVLLYVYAYEIARDPEMPATIRRLVHHVFIAREGSSVSTRDVNYAMAYRLFLGAPALGIGWGNFSTAVSILGLTSPYPHNLFLELLAETGLAGTTAFVVVFAYLLLKFFRSGDETEEKSWIVVLFIAGFTISMVSGEYTSQRLLFFSLGAMADYLAKLHERSA
jgi:O-antigen ligase